MKNNGSIPSDPVEIRPLTVEIKALRVGSKQMTQALFRQLPQKRIIDPDTAEIRGAPWCHVNYFWDGCDRFRERSRRHTHLVWQEGDRLYRDCLYDEVDASYLPTFDLKEESSRVENAHREMMKSRSSLSKVMTYVLVYLYPENVELADDYGNILCSTEDICGYGFNVSKGDAPYSLKPFIQVRQGAVFEPEREGEIYESVVRGINHKIGRKPDDTPITIETFGRLEARLHELTDNASSMEDKIRELKHAIARMEAKATASYHKVKDDLEQFYIAV